MLTIINPLLTTIPSVSRCRSAVDPLARDEIFGERLRVVEDDEHGRLGDVVGHAVVPEGDAVRLLQRGRLHRVAAFGVVAREDLGHEDVLVSVGVRGRVLFLDGQRRVDGKIHALTVDGGCGKQKDQRKELFIGIVVIQRNKR